MRSALRVPAVVVIIVVVVFSLSCGQDQQLVSITVTPDKVNFQGIGAQSQMTALGSFIHPPATKDITNWVTWSTDVPTEVTVSPTGLVTAINTCGSGQVIASVYSKPSNPSAGSVIRATADVAILLNGSSNCSQLANLTVTIGGGIGGTVTSSPAGIACPGVCSANFTLGTTVTLTAVGSGAATFSTWSGCDSMSGNICVVTTNAARNVTANFV